MSGHTGTGTASNGIVNCNATGITGTCLEYIKAAGTKDITTS